MGERDDALRTIADARTRLSALADELGRRAAPEHVKEVAREMVTGRAEELKHQARDRARHKMDSMKQHAKEVAMRRTREFRQEVETPRGMGLLGALLGAGVGSMLARKIFEARRERQHDARYRGDWREGDRDWGYERTGGQYSAAYSSEDGRYHDTRPRYETRTRDEGDTEEWRGREPGATWQQPQEQEGPGMGARASEKMQGAKERASETAHIVKERASETVQNVKERASETVQNVKERASGMMGSARERASGLRERYSSRDEGSGRDLRGRANDWYGRAVNEQPVALALGAFAFGALAAALLPVTSKERQVLEPARRKAEEAVSQMSGRIEERLGISGSEGSEQPQSGSQQPWSGQGSASSGQDYNTYGTEETSSQASGGWSSGRMETAGTSGTREWNDRREVTSPDPAGTSTSGSVAASTAMTAGTSPESGTPNPPLPSAGELGKSHTGR